MYHTMISLGAVEQSTGHFGCILSSSGCSRNSHITKYMFFNVSCIRFRGKMKESMRSNFPTIHLYQNLPIYCPDGHHVICAKSFLLAVFIHAVQPEFIHLFLLQASLLWSRSPRRLFIRVPSQDVRNPSWDISFMKPARGPQTMFFCQ